MSPQISCEYDSTKDVTLYRCDPGNRYYDLRVGDFLILYPCDAYCPCISVGANSTVEKIVIKVPC